MQLKEIFEIEREEKLKLLNKESQVMLDLRDNALKFTNRYLDLLSKTSLENFISYCEMNNVDPSKINLKEYIKNNDLELGVTDFYVIDTNGIVVNTSFDKDLKLDFYSFGPEYKQFIQNRFKEGDLHIDEFSVESNTKKLRKYAYQAITSREYLIEFGVYSEESKLLKSSVVKGLDDIVASQKNIKSMDIITSGGHPYSLYHPELKIDSAEEKLINDLFKSSDTSYYKVEKKFIYNYKVVPRGDNQLYEHLMVRIVYDREEDKTLLRKELYSEFALFFAGISALFIILYLNVKRLVKPILKLSAKAKLVGQGNLSERAEVIGSNEITDLTVQFNNMVDNLESSQNQLLQQNEEILSQSEQIEQQKSILENKNEQITASINYAKRIQDALLRVDSRYKFPEHFIFYRPKDIVGGDFYWMLEKEEYLYMAAADCTGHGVPGGFLTMLGSSFLNEINSTVEMLEPAEILNLLRDKVVKELSQTGRFGESNDGMDISLIRLNLSKMELEWAGANNPLFIVRDGELEAIKGDREPIGYTKNPTPFKNHKIEIQKGDLIYLFSDGYPDQFGGPKNKKFGYRQLKELLVEVSDRSIDDQRTILTNRFDEWLQQGTDKQIDDVCLLGIKIS